MSVKDLSTEFCNIIDTYAGRDKVMKVLCYAAKLISGYYSRQKPELSKQYAIASAQISGARATLRLIDDIPVIQHILVNGWRNKERDLLLSCLAVIDNIVSLVYCPLESICWLMEHKIINIKSPELWDTLNTTFWVLSIYINLLGTLIKVTKCQYNFNRMDQQILKSLRMQNSMQRHRLEIISILRLTLDFVHAVSYLPRGYLWGGKLSTTTIGAIGTCSALIGIHQIFTKRHLERV